MPAAERSIDASSDQPPPRTTRIDPWPSVAALPSSGVVPVQFAKFVAANPGLPDDRPRLAASSRSSVTPQREVGVLQSNP
jgi:hypothetical protein